MVPAGQFSRVNSCTDDNEGLTFLDTQNDTYVPGISPEITRTNGVEYPPTFAPNFSKYLVCATREPQVGELLTEQLSSLRRSILRNQSGSCGVS